MCIVSYRITKTSTLLKENECQIKMLESEMYVLKRNFILKILIVLYFL
jgi:hypothetical protein